MVLPNRMQSVWYGLVLLLITTHFYTCEGFQEVVTEQEVLPLPPHEFLVQLLTEPESLIRIFEGLDLSFQMLRHVGRTGPALMRLPFDKEFLSKHYQHEGLDYHKRPYYARLPTMFSHEAPRYVRVSSKEGYQKHAIFNRMQLPMPMKF